MTQVTHGIRGSRWLFASLAATLVITSAAQAAPAVEARSVKVSYGDLNLASDGGAQLLYGRIVSAAREVCEARRLDNRDLRAVALEHRCEAQAIAAAVSSVNSPRLAALHGSRTAHG
jgi:UrcA family protein